MILFFSKKRCDFFCKSSKKVIYCSTVSAISFFLAHSGQMMSSASVINPLPTRDPRQDEQTKQSLCQWRPSKEMNLVPPMPIFHNYFGQYLQCYQPYLFDCYKFCNEIGKVHNTDTFGDLVVKYLRIICTYL